jgi:hypothetical protein
MHVASTLGSSSGAATSSGQTEPRTAVPSGPQSHFDGKRFPLTLLQRESPTTKASARATPQPPSRPTRAAPSATTSWVSLSESLMLLGKSLGQGTFGKVRIGTHTITNEQVAIKILEKDKIKDKADVERVTREINILKKVRHPNVIQLYEVNSLYYVTLFAIDHRNFEAAVSDNGVRFRR